MALNTQLSTAATNAQASAIGALCNNGYLRLYTGPQRANANTPLTTQILLAELRFDVVAFGSAVDGVITANPIIAEDAAIDNGDAVWFAAYQSDGATPVFDGSVGISNANLIFPTTTISAGLIIEVNSLTYTQPGA